MPRRTIFLDVIDPSLPEEVQLDLEARLRDLSGFDELRPSLWKRVCAMLSMSSKRSHAEYPADTTFDEMVNCVGTGCELVSIVECGVGCFCM